MNLLRAYGTPVDIENFYIPPGDFWIGVNGPHPSSMHVQAGVFVSFRRRGRPRNNPWWWEYVYAILDSKDRLVLHAYNYNYLGMPLSPPRGVRWNWRARNEDVLWIESLREVIMGERREYVRRVTEDWDASNGAFYHSHGFVRNGLRKDFELPPHRF